MKDDGSTDLYQPESGAEPVKKGGVLFRAGTNPTDTGALKGGVESNTMPLLLVPMLFKKQQ